MGTHRVRKGKGAQGGFGRGESEPGNGQQRQGPLLLILRAQAGTSATAADGVPASLAAYVLFQQCKAQTGCGPRPASQQRTIRKVLQWPADVTHSAVTIRGGEGKEAFRRIPGGVVAFGFGKGIEGGSRGDGREGCSKQASTSEHVQ